MAPWLPAHREQDGNKQAKTYKLYGTALKWFRIQYETLFYAFSKPLERSNKGFRFFRQYLIDSSPCAVERPVELPPALHKEAYRAPYREYSGYFLATAAQPMAKVNALADRQWVDIVVPQAGHLCQPGRMAVRTRIAEPCLDTVVEPCRSQAKKEKALFIRRNRIFQFGK